MFLNYPILFQKTKKKQKKKVAAIYSRTLSLTNDTLFEQQRELYISFIFFFISLSIMNKTFWPTSNFITSSNKSLMKFVFSFFPPLEELKKKSVWKKKVKKRCDYCSVPSTHTPLGTVKQWISERRAFILFLCAT